MQDHMCSWVTTSHLSSSSLNSTPLVWPLQASTRSDDSLATDNTTSWLLFLGALGVLFVLFVLRLLVFHMFLRQNNLDPFATLPPTELDLEQPSSSRRRLPHRPTGIQKNTTSQSKRALKLIASAADSGAPPSPHLAMQIKLYNGEYHPEVERMVQAAAKAIVAIEKQSQLDHKNRLRDQLRHADVLGHHLSSAERQHTKHQAFMLHVRKPSVKPMVVYANDNLTTIKWQVARKPSTKEFVNGGAHTLHFVDVQSIAPWTNELPPLFEAKYRHLLKDGADEHCFYAVLVVYLHAKKRTKQKHLLLQAKDIDDQTHLADTLAKLVASAKRRRDSPVTTPLPPAAAVVVAEPTNIVAATPTIGDE
ncbi:hypothetical protein DYB37_005753 [Aphanomyces astaci]|uniref:Uncharacterized protein n=1 Tax=Aphanomyces astaci TaxID=112090 RepID=A0A397CXS4_APHAT|nr:hypothetical protein DYB36_000604 [Aphanomyces astaci]RHY18465.1 hypothetical protein DYB25_005781 [Aphanomyces astaci]RHY51547.1 hypothetical protein DYB38_006334 [Aphanomyces astaci]RHY56889.1 hypothetical protein DYB30_005374 [Aphanomyces astaci]RHY58847.1 hypothetical protein DYB34_004966 [Aphanomyces astaci]